MKKEYISPNTKLIRCELELLTVTSMYDEKGGPAEAKRNNSRVIDDMYEDEFEDF